MWVTFKGLKGPHVSTLSWLFWEHVSPIGGDRPLCNMYKKRSSTKTCSSRQKTSLFCQLPHSEPPVILIHEVLSTTPAQSHLTSVHQEAKFLDHCQVPAHPVNAIHI